MKYYLLDSIERIKAYSLKLDAESFLYNKSWTVLSDDKDDKIIFIFRTEQELLISSNGVVRRGCWELLSVGAILIDMDNKTYLYNVVFMDDIYLLLRLDGNSGFLIMMNDSKTTDKIRSINDIENDLDNRYLSPQRDTSIELEKRRDNIFSGGDNYGCIMVMIGIPIVITVIVGIVICILYLLSHII